MKRSGSEVRVSGMSVPMDEWNAGARYAGSSGPKLFCNYDCRISGADASALISRDSPEPTNSKPMPNRP